MSSRFFVLGIAVSTCLLAVGCSKSAKVAQPGLSDEHQTGPAWKLTLKSTCLDASQDQCLAKYGFTVNAEGGYQVGPGPQGQQRTGTLSDSEFAPLKSQINAALATSASAAEQHAGDVENLSNDSLTLARANFADLVLAHNDSADFYYTTATLDQAKSLHDAIRDLANSHYRLPFGDACGDAADKITAAATALNHCQTDSDCAYVDAYQGFATVPPSSTQYLLTEDCSAVLPPVVANRLAIDGGAQGLLELYTSARTTCGEEFSQSHFDHACSIEQKSTATQPACIQNLCQARF